MIWNKDRLDSLIEKQIEENLHLEYKSSGAIDNSAKKKEDISKIISSFANSDGGTVIFGIKEFDEKDKRHLPERLDPINSKLYNKEWIEQIIDSNINPRIDGIEIIPVSINNSANKTIFIVEIPKSNTAHQAKDFRYYKRQNFKTTPMYDYEIKDIMNRQITPRLEINFEKRISKYSYRNGKQIKRPSYYIIPIIYNVGVKVAKYVRCNIFIPDQLGMTPIDNVGRRVYNSMSYLGLPYDNTTRDAIITKPSGNVRLGNINVGRGNTFHYGPKRYVPILPNLNHRLKEINIPEKLWEQKFEIFWEIFADDSIPRYGKILNEKIEYNT